MFEAPAFTSVVVSRRRALSASTRRVLPILVALALHLSAAALLLVIQMLVVDAIPPPRARVPDGVPPIRVEPRGASARPPGPGTDRGGGPSRAPAPARPAPAPIAPPEAATPAPLLRIGPGEDGPASRAGGSGGGEGPGDGDGPGGGTGPGCPGCTGDADGPFGPGIGPRFDERDPRLIAPVIIASSRALPAYPEMARRARVEGTVILLIVISRDGTVGEVEVLRSPDPRFGFDLAAIEAVKRWRYRPGTLAGRPVAVEARVIVEFALSR